MLDSTGVTSVALAIVPADHYARVRNACLLAFLSLWMLYTRFFWPLHSVNATIPRCPFLTVTGHPCPLCGGTRSFAYTWNGDFGHALLLYPLGPVFFIGTVVGMVLLIAALVKDRDVQLLARPALLRALPFLVALPLLVNWALKLTVLPN